MITDMDFDYSDSSDIVNTGYNTLFAGSDAIVLARYHAGTGSIDVVTRTGSRSFDETFSVISRPENSFVPKLWAYTKIRKLMDRTAVEGETDPLVSEITDLSLEFGFATPYTALFVEVPIIDKISETTTASTKLVTPEEVSTVVVATEGEGATGAAPPVPTAVATSTRTLIKSEATEESDAGAPRPVATEPQTKKKCPGFGALFAIAGFAAVAYLVRRR